MNATFLLVTTAWLAGAEPAAAPAAAAMKPAPMAAPAAVVVDSGCSGCSGCSSCGECDTCSTCAHGWHERLRGLFASRHSCGCDTCATTTTCCAPAPTCCAPAPTCSTCEVSCDSCGGWTQRFRGLFHRHSDCGCDTCSTCSTCSSCGAAPMMAPTAGAAPKAESIPAPKETPAKRLPNSAPKAKTSQISTPETIPVPVGTPALEAAPAIVPNVPANADRKDPF